MCVRVRRSEDSRRTIERLESRVAPVHWLVLGFERISKEWSNLNEEESLFFHSNLTTMDQALDQFNQGRKSDSSLFSFD